MQLTLKDRKQEVPGVETFIFEPYMKSDIPIWKAGQYLHYMLHHEPTDDRGSDRWFTIASAPFTKHPQITTRYAPAGVQGSSFKKALLEMKVGDFIEAEGPYGDFIVDDLDAEYVFIAGGIGITPFHSILAELDHSKKKIKATLLYGSRDENIVFKNELETFARNNSDLKIVNVVAPLQINDATIKKNVPDISKPIFYVSGPEPMVNALSKTLKEMGVPEAHIKGDWFPGYEAQ